VHLQWDACYAQLKHSFKNGKLSYKSIVFEVICNNRRNIFSCTKAYPGTQADKTISEQDDTVYAIRNDPKFTDVNYVLKNSVGEDVPMKGVYLLSDNGFHKWKIIAMPMKTTVNQNQKRWSQWCESMIKDIECTFGILKKRFLFLKNPIRIRSKDAIEKVFHFCCIIHNILLSIDGMDDILDVTNAQHIDQDLPLNAFHRILQHEGEDEQELLDEDKREHVVFPLQDKKEEDKGFKNLRSKLIEHFNYKFQKKEIYWPH
jgi:hypothetical protein